MNINNFSTAPLLIYRGPFSTELGFFLDQEFLAQRTADRAFRGCFLKHVNHVNFASPAQADRENPSTFGRITQTVGMPSLIQFSLRYEF